ncbi:MAG: hypothetical protein ACFCU6_00995 [Balneolaceae bacterium]
MKGIKQILLFLVSIVLTGSLLSVTSTDTKAQTIYSQDKGLFSPILSSFYVRSNIVENTQKIGPMAGYRFNENFDIALHTEFFSNKSKALTEESFSFSMMNLGIIAGYSEKLSENSPFTGRVELRAYHAFLFSSDTEFSTPRSSSAIALASIFYPVEASASITIRPNIGTFVGYGNYQLPSTSHTSTNPTQAFNGLQFGPKIGFDTSINISGNTTITAVPALVMKYNQTTNTYNTDFEFGVVLNF